MGLAGIRIIGEEAVSDPVFAVGISQFKDAVTIFKEEPKVDGNFSVNHLLESARGIINSLFSLKISEARELSELFKMTTIDILELIQTDNPEEVFILAKSMKRYADQISTLISI